MKNVLLATTALVFTAGFAAAETTMSASASLEYGNWDSNGVGENSFDASAELGVSASGEASGISYTAGLTIEDGQAVSIGAITMSSAGFTVTYHANELEGVDNEAGDWKVDYANAGFSFSYENDEDSDQMLASASYSADGLTVGATLENAGSDVTGVNAAYTMGNITVAVSADDADDWNASLAYATGATTVTLSTDESEVNEVEIETSMNGLSLGASYNSSEESTLSVGYTMGEISVAIAYDSTNAGGFGDDAETIMTVGYDLGGIDLEFEANDSEEMHATASFTF